MERLPLIISFLMTGFLPLFFGVYLAQRQDYFLSVGCFFISLCGFQQIYHTLKVQELFGLFKDKINEQAQQLEDQKEEFLKQRKQLTQNLADLFGMKMKEQENLITKQQRELANAARFLEQKNKEIWKLRDYYYD